jgi:hypothetical protein
VEGEGSRSWLEEVAQMSGLWGTKCIILGMAFYIDTDWEHFLKRCAA